MKLMVNGLQSKITVKLTLVDYYQIQSLNGSFMFINVLI